MRVTSSNSVGSTQRVASPKVATRKPDSKDRMSLLKEKIHNGEYTVDKKKLAEAIIKFELGEEIE